jgi:hypothetical protein
MNTVFSIIEDTILEHGTRGMDNIRRSLRYEYTSRAADLLLKNKGVVLIGTGFPAAGSFETDGPLGAIALYKTLEHLGHKPIFVCAQPISEVLKNHYKTLEFPILNMEESVPIVKAAILKLRPSLVISIERAGAAADARYYNMHKQDITPYVTKFDLFFEFSGRPTIGIGDGGNEIGMGKVYKDLLSLPIIPAVTSCDELIVASTSNWGAYGIIAALSVKLKQDLFKLFNIRIIMKYLVQNGSVDGVNHSAEYSEDGFPLETGLAIIKKLENIVNDSISANA